MPATQEPKARDKTATASSRSPLRHALMLLLRVLLGLFGLAIAGTVAGFTAIAIALAVAYPNLPNVDDLADYRPKLPLRVLSADGVLIGEFGEERRNLLTIKEIPPVMINAVLAIEDARFFEHSGVDYRGMVRAGLANLAQARSQGASTITMQVARNVYLSAEKSYTRKIYEVLLTFKLEHSLSKEKILEIYMNQIFLGHRAYGFSTAARTYFGKPLKDVTIAEAAMLAGLPKAPSAFNPFSNPRRARARQLHIIDRMLENGYITEAEAAQAKIEPLKLRRPNQTNRVRAEYAAEMARQAMVQQYGEEAYTRGLVVTTSIDSVQQRMAYEALRKGLTDFERRQFYRGPERFIDLPTQRNAQLEAIDEALQESPDNGDLLAAVVIEASPTRVVVMRQDGEPLAITGDGLSPVRSALSTKAGPNVRLRPGAVVRILAQPEDRWRLTQVPEVEGALVAVDSESGAIKALVGGFDFNKNNFNHATQAWRQPGSSFKPFVYSAALEKGLSPSTLVNDAPLFYSARQTGGKPWEPKNYDGRFSGPMTVTRGLAQSKNMVSIRILELVGAKSTQDWVTRFGFDAQRHPAFLTMALGAGSVTPLQMASGFGVFANGGHYLPPVLIQKVTDNKGRVLFQASPQSVQEKHRTIDARNAFVMNQLMREVTRSGTAARAQSLLKRSDIYGKTGTTNDSIDAWFVGFQPKLVAAVWIGYGTPRNLGSRETGGGLSLPVWIDFMRGALANEPVATYPVPNGLMQVGGSWFYREFGPGNNVRGLGLQDPWPGQEAAAAAQASPAAEEGAGANPSAPSITPQERSSILDMFRQ